MTVSNSYATGAVTSKGSDYVGGLIGKYYSPVSSSYSTGKVTLTSGEAAGGLIGFDANISAIADCYWDLDSSGIDKPSQGAGNVKHDPGIKGLMTAQFNAGLPKGFDPNIWQEKTGVNNGYPYLIDLPPG